MKPIRDLLLERHAAAGPRLDAVRRRVIDSLATPAATRMPFPEPRLSAWQMAWEELFVRARVAWTGLAIGGVAALVLNARVPAPGRTPERPEPTVSIVEVREERAALLAELLDSPPPPIPPAPPAPALGPRRSSLTRSPSRGLPA